VTPTPEIRIKPREGVGDVHCDGSLRCKQKATMTIIVGPRIRHYCVSHARDAADNEITRMVER
jgi:hypothetical protein